MHDGDALERLNELRDSTRGLVDEYTRTAPAASSALLEKILLAFELRWKLEALVLLPALEDTPGVTLCSPQDAERELLALRDLAGLARDDALSQGRQRLLLTAIETVAALRTQRLGLALTHAQASALLDLRALGLEMGRWLERWQHEVSRRGDIEDEEMDPVGLPPR